MKRLAAELPIALALAWLLGRSPLLPPGDPFRWTLLLAPFLVVAFRALERTSGPPRGGGAWRGQLEWVAAGGLVLTVLGRHALGFDGADRLLAGCLFLLLAHRIARLLLRLRPALGRRLPRRPSWVFFALPLLTYLALLPWTRGERPPSGDEPYYLLLTHSLAHDLDVDLTNNYAQEDWRSFLERPIGPQTADPVGPNGELYSRHSFLLPLILAPFYRLGGYPAVLTAMAMMTAALAWMILRLAYWYAPRSPGPALLAYATAAFAPPLLLYSRQVWIEAPAALLTACAIDLMWQMARQEDARTPARIALFGLTIAALPLLKLRLGLIALPILGLALWRIRPGWKPLAALATLIGTATGALLLRNFLLFGNPLRIHSQGELMILQEPLSAFLRGFLGLFYDTSFGLFATAPIWLLLLPALWQWITQRHVLILDLAWIAGPYLLLLAPRIEWFGGWSPPFRYPLVFLPLLALALIPAFENRHRGGTRSALAALVPLTLLLAAVWTVVPGWTYNLADGRTHLINGATLRIGDDITRLFPSFVRPRPASWIWPLMTLGLIPLVHFFRKPRHGTLWGTIGLLALLVAAPLLATRWPTSRLQVEDAHVEKRGGVEVPAPWTEQRAALRGGWGLTHGAQLISPVHAGGRQVRISLEVRFLESRPDPFHLVVAAGAEVLERWRARAPGGWQKITMGPFRWPAEAPLVLSAEAAAAHLGGRNVVIVDYVDFAWE